MLLLRLLLLSMAALSVVADHAEKAVVASSFKDGHLQVSSHGQEGRNGYNKKHRHESRNTASHGKGAHTNEYADKGGKKSGRNDEAGRYAAHHESEKGHKSAKFGEKQGHKRGHKTKGYHNKFIRDEFHREHKFYDDFHKSGHHSKSGEHSAKYNKKSGGHKNAGNLATGYHDDLYGNQGRSEAGNYDQVRHGFGTHRGREALRNHALDYGQKGGRSEGKRHGYAVLER